jgi:hypothetical protein
MQGTLQEPEVALGSRLGLWEAVQAGENNRLCWHQLAAARIRMRAWRNQEPEAALGSLLGLLAKHAGDAKAQHQ